MEKEWFSSWFNTSYYHILYKHRDYNEASLFIDNIIRFLNFNKTTTCWDLCCGKGRHSIYLNKKGYRVIGTDLSTESITCANLNANDTLEFYEHDMRKLFRTNYFDVVFNIFTSFGYFDKKQDDINVFNSVAKSLKTDGIFIFDYLNDDYVGQHIVAEETKTIDGIIFLIRKKIENNTIVKTITITDNGKQFYFEERVKLFNKKYFEYLADVCNLKIKECFGNYQLQPFISKTSPRLILVLQKK